MEVLQKWRPDVSLRFPLQEFRDHLGSVCGHAIPLEDVVTPGTNFFKPEDDIEAQQLLVDCNSDPFAGVDKGWRPLLANLIAHSSDCVFSHAWSAAVDS